MADDIEVKEDSAPIKVIKGITNIVTDIGCINIISNIVTFVMPPGVGILSKICMKVGAIFMGSAIADMTNEYTNEKIDKIAEAVEEGDVMKIILD